MKNLKKENNLFLKKVTRRPLQLLTISLIVAIAVGFFITMRTIAVQYEKTATQYYKDYSLADYTVSGRNFSQQDIKKLDNITGITDVQSRTSILIDKDESQLIALSFLADEEILINKPYFYEGRPAAENECMISKRYADVYGYKTGDNITLTIGKKECTFTITALVATSEYVYMVKDGTMPFSDPSDLGFLYISQGKLQELTGIQSNQILFIFDKDTGIAELTNEIKRILNGKTVSDVLKEDQISYANYEADLIQIGSFAIIFPLIFFLVSVMIIYVVQKRNIAKDRKQIGILKAMGLPNRKIVGIYLKYCCLIAVIGSLGGSLISLFIGDFILSAMTGMFEAPTLHFVFMPQYWIWAMVLSLVVCVCSGLLGVKSILKINPAKAMHAEKPRRGKTILLERIVPLWRRLSFNTRYALKSMLRNKGRFFAMVTGMAACVMLCVFSFGFSDSFDYTINNHYDNLIKYDIMAVVDQQPLDAVNHIEELQGITQSERVFTSEIKLSKGENEEKLSLVAFHRPTDMFNINNPGGTSITPSKGAIIPAPAAQALSAKKGDTLTVSFNNGNHQSFTVTVQDICEQNADFTLYMDYSYFKACSGQTEDLYNTFLIKSDPSKTDTLYHKIKETDGIRMSTSVSQSKTMLLKALNAIDFLTVTLIIFAVLLGIAVLYSVSLISLTARSYEFLLLKVMGYSRAQTMLALVKQTAVQIVFGAPLGMLLGNLILYGIKDEFSTASLSPVIYIYPESYLWSVLILICVSAFTLFTASRFIGKLDIVEGLKDREE